MMEQLTDGFTPEFIVYQVDDWLFVIGDENRVDVQILNPKLHPDSVYRFPLKLFTLNNNMVRADCPDKDREIYVRADVRRDGLDMPDVFSLEGECSAGIRASRDWCERIILLAADSG